MSMGGGGGDFMAPPDHSLELQRESQAEAERLRLIQEQKDATKLGQQTEAFGSGLASAQDRAKNQLHARFAAYDSTPNAYNEWLIGQAIDQRAHEVPSLDPSPGSYFGSDWVDSVLGSARNDYRNHLTSQANQAFAPGFEKQYFQPTADDSVIANVLDTQRMNAQTSVDAAHARGNLNDTGYSAAQTKLDDLYKAGSATANTLGQSVLDRYRENIFGIGNEAKTAASAYDFSSAPLDINSYRNRMNDLVTQQQGSLEGDVRGALQGQEFFNIGDILGSAGVRQGAVNPRVTLPSILAQRDATRNTPRGLGGSGVF